MSQAADPVPAPPSRSMANLLLLTLLLLMGVVHLVSILHRGIDPDELEHLHAAFMLHRGELPYRDFFEHHGPALYVVAQPLFWVLPEDLSLLWAGRGCMVALSFLSLWLTGRIAREVGGPSVALPAMTLLAWTTVFHIKSLEFRPDVPALTLLLCGARLLITHLDNPRLRTALGAGVLCGLATLFTQKSIVPAVGLILGFCIAARPLARPGTLIAQWIRQAILCLVTFAAGGALPWLAALGAFAALGSLGPFFQEAVLQVGQWPVRTPVVRHLAPAIAANLIVWVAAGLFAWRMLMKRLQKVVVLDARELPTESEIAEDRAQRAASMLLVTLAVCVGALPLVRAAYPQYYLLWWPLLVIPAANQLVAISRETSKAALLFTTVPLALLFATAQVVLFERVISDSSGGALPYLAEQIENGELLLSLAMLILLAAVCHAAARGSGQSLVAPLILLGLFSGILRIANNNLWPIESKVAAIRMLNQRLPRESRVLDGFSGIGVLRPHALYYWWINEHSRAMVLKDGAASLITLLEQQPPDAILLDRELLANLPDDVLKWIDERYEDDPEFLKVRNYYGRDPTLPRLLRRR